MNQQEQEGGQFSKAQAAFLRGLVVNRPARRRSPGLAGQLAQFGIGTIDPGDPGFVNYTSADFARANQVVGGGSVSVAKPVSRVSRQEEEPANDQYLAVSPINMGDPAWPGGRCVTLSVQDAIALDFEAILICERFEVLQRLQHFGWLADFVRGRRTLAVCQGGGKPYGTAPVNLLIEKTTAPVLAFLDFDPPALQRAASMPRLEAVCLPNWAVLETALRNSKRNAPSEFALNRNRLDATPSAVVAPIWEQMKSVRRVLNQNRFPR